MSTDKSDLLRKIQGLLAKAESSQFEGERESFMAKADELMQKYTIELWEIQQHEQGRIDSRKPVIQDFDYKFAFESGPFPDICDSLWTLFISVSRHANCTIVYHKQHYSNVSGNHQSYTVPIIGTEADLGYLTLLFSSLMTQLVEQIHPHADPNKSYYENLRMFREAGWSWPEVGKAMQAAGFLADKPYKWAYDKMTRDYRAWCKRTGTPQNYAHHKTYRRNFAYGFSSRVDVRLMEMRQASAQSLGTGLELALRDQKKINEEFMFEMFPNTGGMRGTIAKSSKKFDSAAMAAGRSAGDKANISANPTKGVKTGGGRSLNK